MYVSQTLADLVNAETQVSTSYHRDTMLQQLAYSIMMRPADIYTVA